MEFMELTGEKVCLRRLEAGDLDFLYRWENDPDVWQYGDCGAATWRAEGVIAADTPPEGEEKEEAPTPLERFTRDELREFIENQQFGFHAAGQLRLVICRRDPASPLSGISVGFIDLFDFDPVGLRAGVGILICAPQHRGRGYGREALKLASDYARRVLGLRSLWCSVATDNTASLALFSGAKFVPVEAIPSDAFGGPGISARRNEIFLQKSL